MAGHLHGFGWSDNVGAARHGQCRAARRISTEAARAGARTSFLLFLVRLLGCALERGAENVAERCSGIGRAVLRDCFLLLRHFQRLDRHRHLSRTTIELRHAGIDLLADGEALGPLLGAVAGKLGTLDEGGEVGADDLHVDAGLLHLGDLGGDDRALLEVAGGAGLGEGVALELLDAERDALLLDVDVEHLGAHHVALLVLVDDLLARAFPVEVRQVHHAVDVAVEAEEQAELGLVLDLALDHAAGRMLLEKHLPRIAHGLLEAERDAALDRIDLEHLHLHLLRGRDDLAWMHVLLGPRHFGDVDEALDARLELDEGAVVGDVGDAALEARAHRELGLDALPRIGEELLHAKRDAVGLVVDLDDLDLHLLADVEHLGRVIDAPPGNVGDVQEAVDAAEVDKGAVVRDVLDHAVDDLTLFEILHQLLALLGARLFQHGAARDHDVAAAPVHLQDLERLRHVHQRRDIADRPDVHLAARQERDGAVEVDREAALDLVEDDARNLLVRLERLFELAPALLAPRLVARQHRLAERVLHPLEVDLDGIADLQVGGASGSGEFAQRHPSFGLQADVDDGDILFNADHGSLDDGSFVQVAVIERFLEQLGKILARRRGSLCGSGGHGIS